MSKNLLQNRESLKTKKDFAQSWVESFNKKSKTEQMETVAKETAETIRKLIDKYLSEGGKRNG